MGRGRGGGRYSVVLTNLHLRIVCDPFVGINEFCETTLSCHLSGLSVILTTVIHLGSTGSILPRGGGVGINSGREISPMIFTQIVKNLYILYDAL